MATRKTTLFYAVLLAVVSAAVGMVISSRLDLAPTSSAQTLAVPAMNSAPLDGPLDMGTFRDIAATQSPMVVNISTEARRTTNDLSRFFGDGDDDLLRRFFGDPAPRQQERRVEASGTGFIISQDGFILTNNHVIEGATKIVVRLYGEVLGRDDGYEARVVGTDAITDSALIQLVDKPDTALPVAKFGDSSQMAAGDWVMAIGNPFNLAHTVSVGVISAVGRPFRLVETRNQDMLQTDAAINPGNSGGPLLNLRGEVVGVNTMIYANQTSSGNIGIGFAVPINIVRELLPQLRTGKVTRGVIGVGIEPVPQDALEEFGLQTQRGAVVSTVTNNGPADRAGVQPGDVVLQFNEQPVNTTEDLVRMVVATQPGTTVPMTVLRSREELTLNITVDELDLQTEARPELRTSESNESEGFGITLGNLTPELARRLDVPSNVEGAVIAAVDPDGPAARRLVAGDVILQVNRRSVGNAAEASGALQAIPDDRSALLLIWRSGEEVFLTIRKE